uniref:UDENN domain-containing protein n=1 Tax=Echinostoma caproni TaxID=27848 RepID=A0A183AMI3_9TREM
LIKILVRLPDKGNFMAWDDRLADQGSPTFKQTAQYVCTFTDPVFETQRQDSCFCRIISCVPFYVFLGRKRVLAARAGEYLQEFEKIILLGVMQTVTCAIASHFVESDHTVSVKLSNLPTVFGIPELGRLETS